MFASKTRSKVLCEVRINGREDSELSELLLPYAQNWDCIGSYHTEKQNFLLIQEERSYEPRISQGRTSVSIRVRLSNGMRNAEAGGAQKAA